MRAAIMLDSLVKKLRDAKVSKALVAEVEALYAAAYKEAYRDGRIDCEEKQMNRANEEA